MKLYNILLEIYVSLKGYVPHILQPVWIQEDLLY